jgi:hypothetical protein
MYADSQISHIKSKLFAILNKRQVQTMFDKSHKILCKLIEEEGLSPRHFFGRYAIERTYSPLFDHKLGKLFLCFFEEGEDSVYIGRNAYNTLIISIIPYLTSTSKWEKDDEKTPITFEIFRFIFLIILNFFYNTEKSALPSSLTTNESLKHHLEMYNI